LRVAHVEPVGGVSGNILLGAWLDAGLPREPWLRALRELPVGQWELQEARVERAGVAAQWIDFEVSRGVDAIQPGEWPVSEAVRAEFVRLAGRVASAEWGPAQRSDFCLDVAGFLLARELLGVQVLTCDAIPLGQPNGRPNPRADLAALLHGVPVQGHPVPHEMTTLTGALLLSSLCEFRPARLTLDKIGVGAGTDEFSIANVTRLWLGTVGGADVVWQLECNLDDVTPQQLAPMLERLLASGALDAWIVPVTMKKGRPGFLLSALVGTEQRSSVERELLGQLPTLGLRTWAVERRELSRTIVLRQTAWGEARFKQSPGRPDRVEFEDAKLLAEKHGVPLWEMMRRLEESR
jgi:pyridinium-3,5-bisthiocarboxylic acid mononucleotide nickel chelatase